MKPVLYGIGTAFAFLLLGFFLIGGQPTETFFVGALLAGLIAWGVAEIKETVYYYYERLKEDKNS